MMKDDACPMFDLNLMDFFYNPDYENDTNVINAWYVYVLKILAIVSKKWRDATAPEKLSNEKSMFSFISISDEALMRWFLIIWVSNLANKNPKEPNSNDGNKENLEENEKNMPSKRKRGPHDTNAKLSIYTKLFHEISRARRDYNTAVRWNLIFWNEVRKRTNYNIDGTNASSKHSKYFDHSSDLPLPDLNENQEFLASYTYISNNNNDSNNLYDNYPDNTTSGIEKV